MRIEITRIEIEWEVPVFRFPVAQFDLHVEVGGNRILTIEIVDVVVDVVVAAPPIALVVEGASADGQAIVESGHHPFASEGALVTDNPGRIELDAIALKERGKLVEPGSRRSAPRDDIQIG